MSRHDNHERTVDSALFAQRLSFRFSSGKVLIADWFTWSLWSGNHPPELDRQRAQSDEFYEQVANSSDWQITGPDARRAGELFDEQGLPTYLFDIPPEAEEWLVDRFARLVEKAGLDARLVRLDSRVSHERRAAEVLRMSPLGGELPVHGSPVVVARLAQNDEPLEVVVSGAPVPTTIALRHAGSEKVVERRELGCVLPQEERLVLVDLSQAAVWSSKAASTSSGLESWPLIGAAVPDFGSSNQHTAQPDLSRDGDGDHAHHAHDEHSGHGHAHHAHDDEDWHGVSVEVVEIDEHVRVLSADVGDAAVVSVSVGLNEEGEAVELVIDVPQDPAKQAELVQATWPRMATSYAVVSNEVWKDGEPVGFLHRDPPQGIDSGWCLYSGEESQQYCDDESNFSYVPIGALVHREPALREVFLQPAGTAFSRRNAAERFEPIEDWSPDDD